MRNLKQYFANIRSMALQLDPESPEIDFSTKEIWLTSVDNADTGSVGGQTTTAVPMVAAQAIVNATHRLAEPHEIEAEKARRDEQRQHFRRLQAEAKGNTLPPQIEELANTLVAAAASQQQQQQQNAVAQAGKKGNG